MTAMNIPPMTAGSHLTTPRTAGEDAITETLRNETMPGYESFLGGFSMETLRPMRSLYISLHDR